MPRVSKKKKPSNVKEFPLRGYFDILQPLRTIEILSAKKGDEIIIKTACEEYEIKDWTVCCFSRNDSLWFVKGCHRQNFQSDNPYSELVGIVVEVRSK